MKTKVHFSSASSTHATPRAFFDELNREFRFNTDVCANPESAKCEHYYTTEAGMSYEMLWPGRPELDGLTRAWTGNCYMNPPYGREISKWVGKAWSASVLGALVVCLLPARTDTAWWHTFIWNEHAHDWRIGVTGRFVRGRLKFGNAENSAPFPSAVIIFRPQKP